MRPQNIEDSSVRILHDDEDVEEDECFDSNPNLLPNPNKLSVNQTNRLSTASLKRLTNKEKENEELNQKISFLLSELDDQVGENFNLRLQSASSHII